MVIRHKDFRSLAKPQPLPKEEMEMYKKLLFVGKKTKAQLIAELEFLLGLLAPDKYYHLLTGEKE